MFDAAGWLSPDNKGGTVERREGCQRFHFCGGPIWQPLLSGRSQVQDQPTSRLGFIERTAKMRLARWIVLVVWPSERAWRRSSAAWRGPLARASARKSQASASAEWASGESKREQGTGNGERVGESHSRRLVSVMVNASGSGGRPSMDLMGVRMRRSGRSGSWVRMWAARAAAMMLREPRTR